MTKNEKALVLKFLNQMECNVGTHTGDILSYDEDGLYAACKADDKDEIDTFNKLAKIVNRKGI